MKKILSFVLSAVLIFVSVCTCFPVSQALASTISVSESDYPYAQDVLRKVCPDLPLGEAEETSRAEFVSAVMMLLKMPQSFSQTLPYKDVSADSPYASAIYYAMELGAISNTSLFYPDSPVTYDQAIKILMCALGYGVKAEYMGGFPTGYLKLAKEAGVGNNLKLQGNDALSHKDALTLIFDACLADMMELTTFGDSQQYSVIPGKTILSSYHHIYTASGIVEANAYTGLYGANGACGVDAVKIGGKTFYGKGYTNLIGKNARVFYNDDTKNTIVHAYEMSNNIFEYDYNDSISASGLTLSVGSINSSKDVKYTLETDYSVIYNGKYYGGILNNSVLNPSAGTVSFIDNDENKNIDVIIIKAFEFGVIDFVNEFEEKVYDKYKKGGMLDFASSETSYFVSEADGTPLELYNLKSGDAVGYVISKDNKLCEIVRYSKKIGGIFTEKTSEGKIIVNGKEYILSEYCSNNVKSLNTLKLGSEVILHLGDFDQVIYVNEYTSSLNYGFYVKTGQTGGLSGEICAMICTQDGNLQEFNLADKIKYNGVNLSKEDAKAHLVAIESKDILLRVVKYSLNADGKINKLYDAEPFTGELGDTLFKEKTDEARPILYSDNTQHGSTGSSGDTLFYYNSMFIPLFHLSPGAPVIQVPISEEYRMDEDYYSFHDTASLKSITTSTSQHVRCFGYDVDKTGANFVLWLMDGGASSAVEEEGASGVVESVTEGLNEDGEVCKIIKMYYNDTWANYYSLPESEYPSTQSGATTLLTIQTMKPGDIVRISYNAKNEITAAEINFSYIGNTQLGLGEKEIAPNFKSGNYVGKRVGYASGYLYSLNNRNAMIIRDKTLDQIQAGAFELGDTLALSLLRGDTVVVEFNRDRISGEIIDAVVSTKKDLSTLDTVFNSGSNADFIVQRSRFWEIYLTVIYVN